MTSCLSRNDYNLAFSILTLMILTNFYNQTPKVTTKIIIQILAILIITDIIWIILFSSGWDHDSEKKLVEGSVEYYWDSLWFIHGLVYICAYLELILKGFLLYYLIVDFKEKYKLNELINLNYDDNTGAKNENNIQNGKKMTNQLLQNVNKLI